MSFVKSIFGVGDNKENEREDDTSEEISISSDTGILSNFNSDLDSSLGSNSSDPDCSTISNFFGYWKSLVNQEAKFQSKLNELTKELAFRDAEANKLKFQMEELQRDAFAKSAGMDRLESELKEAQKECETISRTIRNLENDLENQKKRNILLTKELQEKTDSFDVSEKDYKSKIEYLENTLQELRLRIESLEQQLTALQDEKQLLIKRHEEILTERDEEKKKIFETLEQTQKQKEQLEDKWKKDFENLRTVNILKEQELLTDFEWKLRDIEQVCKKKVEEKEELVQLSLENSKQQETELEILTDKIESLVLLEKEINELKEKTTDQSKTIKNLFEEQQLMQENEENLKSEVKKLRNMIDIEKENLQYMQRLHQQEILDKERKLQQTLNEKRIEIATYWEERLLNEISRLKDELEQIYNEEKYAEIENVKKTKEQEIQTAQIQWQKKLSELLTEIECLKNALVEKEEYYQDEIIKQQSITDQDIFELRRLMNKLDMSHHEKYEKLSKAHEEELEKVRVDCDKKIQTVEIYWKTQMDQCTAQIDLMKQQMEMESQEKLKTLIQSHQNELEEQWENLIEQKKEAIQFLEEKYISKCHQLEEHLSIQQKTHSNREVELLKTVDSLKNELLSKDSIIEDLQSNLETLEGAIQVLNQEVAHQNEMILKEKRECEQKLKNFESKLNKEKNQHENEQEAYRLKFINSQKTYQQTIDHLQKKYNCLAKLFEEVRQRYERRESRQEDLNIISDLKQVISEQEKDLNCLNEEKRFFQMKLMALESRLEHKLSSDDESFKDDNAFVDCTDAFTADSSNYQPTNMNLSIPPTIEEGEE